MAQIVLFTVCLLAASLASTEGVVIALDNDNFDQVRHVLDGQGCVITLALYSEVCILCV